MERELLLRYKTNDYKGFDFEKFKKKLKLLNVYSLQKDYAILDIIEVETDIDKKLKEIKEKEKYLNNFKRNLVKYMGEAFEPFINSEDDEIAVFNATTKILKRLEK